MSLKQERDAREAVKREQDEAYQESLRVDRAKVPLIMIFSNLISTYKIRHKYQEEERTRQENEALRVKKETEEKAFLEAQTKQVKYININDVTG